MKRAFVVNPRSRGATPAFVARARAFFGERGGFEPTLCADPATIENEVARLLDAGAEQIVVIGGDGTVQAAANGFFDGPNLRSPGACLALAPAGTGSDYWRNVASLSARGAADWREVVLTANVRRLDTGIVEWTGGSRRFVNMASLGWSAEIVAAKARQPRWIPGPLAYAVPTLACIASRHVHAARVKLDSTPVSAPLLSLFLSLGAFAGGGMRLGGDVKLGDGAFHLTWLENLSLLRIARELPALYGLGPRHGAGIRVLRAREVEVRSPIDLPIEIDGEALAATGPFRIRIDPASLPVCIPV